MFETFALRLALGLLGSLALLRKQDIDAKFFQIHHLIAIGLLGAAGAFAWSTDAIWFWLPWTMALFGTMAGTWAWSIQELAGLRWYLCVWTIASVMGALLTLASAKTETLGWGLEVAQDVTSAALLGLAITAMLLGHWYLNSPTMSIQPLIALHQAIFIALVGRLVVFVWIWGQVTHFQFRMDQLGWLWLSMRAGAGFIGAAVLSYMSWATAKIRSTQSATGILYVLDIFVILGEIVDLMLVEHLILWGGS